MALTSAYLIATSKLEQFFADLRSARAPSRFTLKFLEDLGYTSTNDRLLVGLLKALGLLDDNGVPTQRYFEFLDDTQWRRVLAVGIQDAYEDLFRLNKRAYSMTRKDLSGKLKSLTEGKKSEKIIENMTRTFTELTKLADFSEDGRTVAEPEPEDAQPPREAAASASTVPTVETHMSAIPHATVQPRVPGKLVDGLTYRIEIVLPAVRDKAVYDALFRSIREHLL